MIVVVLVVGIVLGALAFSCLVRARWLRVVVDWVAERPAAVFVLSVVHTLAVAGIGALLAVAVGK